MLWHSRVRRACFYSEFRVPGKYVENEPSFLMPNALAVYFTTQCGFWRRSFSISNKGNRYATENPGFGINETLYAGVVLRTRQIRQGNVLFYIQVSRMYFFATDCVCFRSNRGRQPFSPLVYLKSACVLCSSVTWYVRHSVKVKPCCLYIQA